MLPWRTPDNTGRWLDETRFKKHSGNNLIIGLEPTPELANYSK